MTCIDCIDEWGPGVAQATPVKLDLTAEQRSDMMRDGVTVVLDRPVNRAAQKMRVVVQDSVSGAVGPVTIPIGAARDRSDVDGEVRARVRTARTCRQTAPPARPAPIYRRSLGPLY